MLTTAVRPPRPTPMVLACYAGFASLGWFLNGLGAVLPDLEERVGERAATAYPLLPGAVMLVWGLIGLRQRANGSGRRHTQGLINGSVLLAVGLVVMGITTWLAVSVAGALLAAVSATYMVRVLPGLLTSLRRSDPERAMMRSNAYSSMCAISAPLAVGASIKLGWGWMPGMAIPVGLFAVAVVVTARADTPPADGDVDVDAPAEDMEASDEIAPPLALWWRDCAVLGMCIVVEFCFSYYATTFLHDELELSKAAAAAGGAAWGIGMAIGRFVVSTLPPPRTVLPSVIGVAIGFVMLWAVPNAAVAIAGIGIAGLGASPLYASRLTALITRFPDSPHFGSTRGSLASGAALVSAPALMGGLRAVSDVRTAYLVVPVLLAALVILARPWHQQQPALAST